MARTKVPKVRISSDSRAPHTSKMRNLCWGFGRCTAHSHSYSDVTVISVSEEFQTDEVPGHHQQGLHLGDRCDSIL